MPATAATIDLPSPDIVSSSSNVNPNGKERSGGLLNPYALLLSMAKGWRRMDGGSCELCKIINYQSFLHPDYREIIHYSVIFVSRYRKP